MVLQEAAEGIDAVASIATATSAAAGSPSAATATASPRLVWGGEGGCVGALARARGGVHGERGARCGGLRGKERWRRRRARSGEEMAAAVAQAAVDDAAGAARSRPAFPI